MTAQVLFFPLARIKRYPTDRELGDREFMQAEIRNYYHNKIDKMPTIYDRTAMTVSLMQMFRAKWEVLTWNEEDNA